MNELWKKAKTVLLRDPFGLTVVVFALAVIPGVVTTKLVLYLSVGSLESVEVAAITEPISTKLLPAYFLLYFAGKNTSTYSRIRSKPALFGAFGGFWLGLAERAMYLIGGSPATIFWILSVGLHSLFGLLVAGAVYWRGEAPWNGRDVPIIVIATMSAMVIHVVWNVVIPSSI